MRLGYKKCLLFNIVRFNKIDVSGEKSEQELSKLTQPDIVNKAKTVTTADLLSEKSKRFVPYVKFYDLFMEWCKKNGTVNF
jgi:hypothetical protein